MQNDQIIVDLFAKLRQENYSELQYVPTRKSIFGFFKEGENVRNLFSRRKHLMFYYSAFPSFYLKRIFRKYPNLDFFYRFCFLNSPCSRQEIETHLGSEWFASAINSEIIGEKRGDYFLYLSVLPVRQHLILRDYHHAYHFHEYDERKPENRVHVGADSIKFVDYNQRHLKNSRFRNALELGCGTGIQLICLENLVDHLTGIDINKRAVEFTKATASLNGLTERFTVVQSDLFQKLDHKFDLIIANPWFLDLEKGGLEEIPAIINQLDSFLEANGTFAIYFGSYIKNNIDQGKNLISRFARDNNYDARFYRLGKTIEPEFLEQYKKLNIQHINSYYAILRKGGNGRIQSIEPHVIRRIRDEIYLPIQRTITRIKKH